VSFVGDLRKNLDIDKRIDNTVAAFVMLSVCPFVWITKNTVDELISPLFKEVLGQELLSALEEAVVGFVVGETSRILLTLTQVRGDLQIWCCKAHLYVKRCDSRRLFSSRETVMELTHVSPTRHAKHFPF